MHIAGHAWAKERLSSLAGTNAHRSIIIHQNKILESDWFLFSQFNQYPTNLLPNLLSDSLLLDSRLLPV